MRSEQLKQRSGIGSDQLRRIFNCVREPGAKFDTVKTYFKTKNEGSSPSNVVIIGKGRIFVFNALNSDGNLKSPQEILPILLQIQADVDCADNVENSIPILSHDNRNSWFNVSILELN